MSRPIAGRIETYVHSDASTGNKGASMVKVACETDFAAKTPEFVEFAKKVAKMAYACQAKQWSDMTLDFPELSVAKTDLEGLIKEKVRVLDIVIMTLTEEVAE